MSTALGEFRVGGIEHLKAAVAQETVDHIGADAATHVVAGFPDRDLAPRGRQHARTPQSGQSRADDQDVDVIACHVTNPSIPERL